MRTKDDYVIVTVSFEVGVTVRDEIDNNYGADADGRRGTVLIERHAVNAEVLTVGVPEPVQGFLKAQAIEQVEGR